MTPNEFRLYLVVVAAGIIFAGFVIYFSIKLLEKE